MSSDILRRLLFCDTIGMICSNASYGLIYYFSLPAFIELCSIQASWLARYNVLFPCERNDRKRVRSKIKMLYFVYFLLGIIILVVMWDCHHDSKMRDFRPSFVAACMQILWIVCYG